MRLIGHIFGFSGFSGILWDLSSISLILWILWDSMRLIKYIAGSPVVAFGYTFTMQSESRAALGGGTDRRGGRTATDENAELIADVLILKIVHMHKIHVKFVLTLNRTDGSSR